MSRFRFHAMCVLVFACAPAFACLNTFKEKTTPELAHEFVAELAKKHSAKPTLENSNDYGVALVMAGKLDDAIALFRLTEQKFPGNAKVAANLGTTLELKGEDDEALEWIREGLKRDANEHEGSEWLHVRILESKIAFKKDPAWFDRNHVLDLDFGKDEVPVAPEILPIENGKLKGAEQLVAQIGYQLSERTKFVKPPDRFVGDLYASRGDLMIAGALTPLDNGKHDAEGEYASALEYGAPHVDLVRKRLARYKADLAALPAVAKKSEDVADYPVVSKRFDRSPAQSSSLWIYIGAAVALTIVLIVIGALIDRRRRKRLEANPPPPIPDIDYDSIRKP